MRWFDRFRRQRADREEDGRWMAELLRARDEGVYDALFGPPHQGKIATPSEALVRHVLPRYDPLWLHNGVFAFEPTGTRPYWVYATAGLSTPWHLNTSDQLPPRGSRMPSGVGVELSIATREHSDRAIRMLTILMLVCVGAWSGARPGQVFERGDRIPMKPLGLSEKGSTIRGLMIDAPASWSSEFVLDSGVVRWLHFVGVTRDEYAWFSSCGDAEEAAMRQRDLGEVTDFSRPSSDWARGASMPSHLVSHFE
jgi:suppressor of fused protein SUFU